MYNEFRINPMADHIPENLLFELKNGLKRIYEDRLHGVYLFGSYARGDQDPESDLDVLIVLNDFSSYSREVKRTGELVSNLFVSRSLVSCKE